MCEPCAKIYQKQQNASYLRTKRKVPVVLQSLLYTCSCTILDIFAPWVRIGKCLLHLDLYKSTHFTMGCTHRMLNRYADRKVSDRIVKCHRPTNTITKKCILAPLIILFRSKKRRQAAALENHLPPVAGKNDEFAFKV